MIRPLHACLGALLLFIGTGCTVSEYVDNYQFEPHPAMAEISASPGPQAAQPAPTQPVPNQPQPSQAAPPPPGPVVVSAYATVVGVYRGNAEERIPASVEVRLRIENHGPPTAVFDPHSFELIDGELLKFPPGIVHPDSPINVPPMKSVILDVFFPFPPGHSWENTDLQTLRAHWQVLVDGHPVEQMAEFHRAYYHAAYRRYYGYGPYEDDPYYPYPVYGGVVVVHRRW